MRFTKTMAYCPAGLKTLYRATDSGHWFDADTMRFFRSRITEHFRRLDDKRALFISTEQGPVGTEPRRATVRMATIVDYVREGGDLVSKVKIETLGEFNQMSVYRAKKAMAQHEVVLR